ncbi:MAG: DUF1214 domain-containing protein [Actinobacteria bacterium ATB1]|nr:DUF1214 domain-containing protein [Actinobacteria bacterium ATB1]
MEGRTWEDFCDALKQAGSVVLADTVPEDPQDRAEGWRYLTRLTRAALNFFLEVPAPEAPAFTRAVDETIKLGMDNPDNVYLAAPVKGEYVYRLTGTRGTVHYLGFGAQEGGYGKTGSLDTAGYLEAKDMHFDADGRFEVIAAMEEPADAQNWLRMSPETRMLQVRQTRMDHENEVLAQVRIERIDSPSAQQPLTPERIDRALREAATFVQAASGMFATWTEDFRQHPNELPRFPPERALAAGGDPNIAYYHGWFDIADDEALVVDLTPPECDFWNIQLANYWMESLDYRYYKVHLNKGTAEYNPDGSVRIVIAATDPGVSNWLDTCGHDHGTMCVRWIGATEHPDPKVTVVRLDELGK